MSPLTSTNTRLLFDTARYQMLFGEMKMKYSLIALVVGTFFAGTASAAADQACYSYTDYESANNNPALCLGSAANVANPKVQLAVAHHEKLFIRIHDETIYVPENEYSAAV